MILNNRFEIIKEIGAGGMGEIYLAEDLKLKRKVAIKRISDKAITDSKSKARFLREAQTASSLDHSNICTIYEIYTEEPEEYIVMQYVDGITIDQIISVKKLSINKIIDIAIQICDGMIEAHAKGVIHRDIKPSNIIIDKKGTVKILDFGLAKFDKRGYFNQKPQDTKLTEQGVIMGTVSYMSPEQAQGDPTDKRTDIFSFGTVLFEIIEGKNPFFSEKKIETLYNVTRLEVEFQREIHNQLKQVVLKTLKKNRKQRYADFDQVKKDLMKFREDVLNQSPDAALKPKRESETELISAEETLFVSTGKTNTSDNEALGDMVQRIRKYKNSTNYLSSVNKLLFRKRKLFISLLLIVLISVAIYYFGFLKKKQKEQPIGKPELPNAVYLQLHPFSESSLSKKSTLPKIINYLLQETMNQSAGIHAVTGTALKSVRSNEKNGSDQLKINLELKGKIISRKDSYTIDFELLSAETNEIVKRFTKTGIGKNSILITQIDSFMAELVPYLKNAGYLDRELKIAPISSIFGKDWKHFELFYRALQYYKKFDTEKSIKLFLKIKSLPIAAYYIAKMYHFKGESDQARKLLSHTIKGNPGLNETVKERILAFKAQLDFDFMSQIQYLNRLKLKQRLSKELFYEIGEAYFHHGDAEKAILNYQRAIYFDPDYSHAINHLGYCFSYQGKHEQALEQFQLYRTKDNYSSNSLDSLGDGYFYQGKLGDSLAMKLSAVNDDPKGVSWAYLTIFDILVLQARYQEALYYLEEYRKVKIAKKELSEREQNVILTKKAFIKYLEKDFEEADRLLKEAFNIYDSPNLIDDISESHWLAGLIALELGQLEKAKVELKWFDTIHERYKISENNYYHPLKFYTHLQCRIYEKAGQLDKAVAGYKKLIQLKTQLSYWITYYNYQFFHTEYIAFLIRNEKMVQALAEIDRCLEFNTGYAPALWKKIKVMESLGQSETMPIYRQIDSFYNSGRSIESKFRENNQYRITLKEKLKSAVE